MEMANKLTRKLRRHSSSVDSVLPEIEQQNTSEVQNTVWDCWTEH